MSLRRTVVQVFSSQIATNFASIIAFVYFTRALGSNGYGSYVLFLGLVNLANFVAGLGIGGAVKKRISEGEPDVFLTGLCLSLIPLVIILSIIAILLPYVNSYIGVQVGHYLLLAIVISQFEKYLIVSVEGQADVDTAASGRLLQRIVLVTSGICLIYMGFGVLGLVVALIVSWGVTSLWLLTHLSVDLGWPTMNAAYSLVEYAKFNFVADAGGRLYNWTDTLVIGLFLGQSFVGIYEVAWRISGFTTILAKSIGKTIFPTVSESHARDKMNTIESLIPNAVTGAIVLIVPAGVGALVVGQELIQVGFGTEYVAAATPLVILMCGRIFEGFKDVLGEVLFGIDRPKDNAKAVFVFIILNILLNIVFVQEFGLLGAAIATSTAFASMSALIAYYLSKVITIKIDWWQLLMVCFASVGMGAAVLGMKQIVPAESVVSLAALIVFGVAVYLVLVAAPKQTRQTIQELAGEIL
ncbi:oligosaccharide flippase family protein [Halorientalis regularis]|nr:polysaccharide biosynthesis C-terminal domain-containing protein [Halorientalis regularis]